MNVFEAVQESSWLSSPPTLDSKGSPWQTKESQDTLRSVRQINHLESIFRVDDISCYIKQPDLLHNGSRMFLVFVTCPSEHLPNALFITFFAHACLPAAGPVVYSFTLDGKWRFRCGPPVRVQTVGWASRW